MNSQNTNTEPKICILLGIPFHDVTMQETLRHIDGMIARRKPAYLATANLDFAAQASRDVELQRILFDAELVLCDGTPLIWASRWLGAPLRERVAGSDLMPFLFAHAEKKGHRIFFLGSSEEVLAIAVEKCAEQYPKLVISGTYSPPYARLLDLNDDEIERRIREATPDILLVAMGCPKQEKWIYKNCRKTGVPVSIGIGASLDFIAGKFSRAPVWMRVCGLEWVFRLMQEPRRLFNRYLFDLVFFVGRLRKERSLMKGAATDVSEKRDAPFNAGSDFGNVVQFAWSGRVDAAAVADGTAVAPAPDRQRPNVMLDCSAVNFIDSTGLGLFIKSFRRCKEMGGTFVVFKPSAAVEKMLSVMQLDRLIPSARDAGEVRALLKSTAPATTEFTQFDAGTKTVTIPLSGDITAATVATCERFLVSAWNNAIQARHLDLDLAGVSFIDSSGLGLLVKAVKIVKQREGATLHIGNASSNVRNVINLANLGTLLGMQPQP